MTALRDPSPQTVADLGHTFSQRLPAGVQGPQTCFGESVTRPPTNAKLCVRANVPWGAGRIYCFDWILRDLCDPKVRKPWLEAQVFQRTVWPPG